MKIVINSCFGGFGVSNAAVLRMRELGSAQSLPPRTVLKGEEYGDGTVCDRDYRSHVLDDRTDPVLVRVVEEMGDAANGAMAKLKVIEIPDGVSWEIDEYDGVESIHEQHRRWS